MCRFQAELRIESITELHLCAGDRRSRAFDDSYALARLQQLHRESRANLPGTEDYVKFV
jgi:hypothetical protein